MTIHYRKILKSIAWVAVCLLGIEQVTFAADDTSNEPKKGSYYGRAKRAANSAKDDVMNSKPVTEATRLANEAKDRVANSKPVTEATRMTNSAKDRVVNSRAGKAAQQAVDDVKNTMCTFKLNQARSNAEKLDAQSWQLRAGAAQLANIAEQQKTQAAQITEQCGGGILCTISLKIASYNGEKYAGLAEKMVKLATEMAENAKESSNKANELETKCGSTD